MEGTDSQNQSGDCAYCFDLTFAIHTEDEVEANKALADLLIESDRLGFDLVSVLPPPIRGG